jgi:hypothetical protein
VKIVFFRCLLLFSYNMKKATNRIARFLFLEKKNLTVLKINRI